MRTLSMVELRSFAWPKLLRTSAAALALLALAACTKKTEEPTADFKPTEAAPLPPGPDKLEIVDESEGTGPAAQTGDTVKVHYTGTLMNGKEFDSSRGRGEPFQFTIGEGHVIKGWDQGVPGMKAGGKRKLTIPWQLAYGEAGSGEKIPPKAALKFDIELVEIVAPDAGPEAKEAKGAKDAGKASAPPKAGAAPKK